MINSVNKKEFVIRNMIKRVTVRSLERWRKEDIHNCAMPAKLFVIRLLLKCRVSERGCGLQVLNFFFLKREKYILIPSNQHLFFSVHCHRYIGSSNGN